ncbi:Proteophosphoglycan precursor (Fragment) [Hyphomicrobiales bacterium]
MVKEPGDQPLAGLSAVAPGRGPAPVDRWDPPFCGAIDMRIAADGIWFYQGSPIRRPALVKLFASVLRKDPNGYVLVTPVECVGITVEDVPFLAVEIARDGAGVLHFRTNVDDLVAVDADHPLRFETDSDGGLRPYLRVRGGLWARLTRALVHDLVELAEERDGLFGVPSGALFFPITPMDDLDAAVEAADVPAADVPAADAASAGARDD